MSATTSIEWTDRSWNPVRGCSLVSPGCKNCYAMKVAHRFSGAGKPYEGLTRLGPTGPTWTGAIRTVPEALDEPLRWRTPQKIFVNSMSDLFHDAVPDAFIDQVFAVMALCDDTRSNPRDHTFQVLTKRAARMLAYLSDPETPCRIHSEVVYRVITGYRPHKGGCDWDPIEPWPLKNVWLGVSCENQHFADERIPLLLQTPAAVRFISAEPLLGPIDLCASEQFIGMCEECHDQPRSGSEEDPICDVCQGMRGLDWVIAGGESGPGARRFDVAWARSIVAQCQTAGVPVFVKQLGAHPLGDLPAPLPRRLTLTDRKGGDVAEWPADLRVREFPKGRQ